MRDAVGFIAIGRNEGERLKRCLISLKRYGGPIVYIDSGSADNSVDAASALGAEVDALSDNEAFTAGRARNAGFDRLKENWPETEFVMFIDGDCELVDGFVDAALLTLRDDPSIGVVTGRCRELYPDATIYNRLCDMEWNGPVGDIDACGGIFMARRAVFEEAGGFNPTVIAAEDDELCIRVRANGHRVNRIAHEMCLHDADMRRFGQWWRRAERAGHAFSQVGDMHPGYFAGPRRRAWLWGLVLPGIAIALAPFTNGWSLILLLLYPVSFIRTWRSLIRNGASMRHAGLHAAFLTLAKFPNLAGMIAYRLKRLKGDRIAIVEYK